MQLLARSALSAAGSTSNCSSSRSSCSAHAWIDNVRGAMSRFFVRCLLLGLGPPLLQSVSGLSSASHSSLQQVRSQVKSKLLLAPLSRLQVAAESRERESRGADGREAHPCRRRRSGALFTPSPGCCLAPSHLTPSSPFSGKLTTTHSNNTSRQQQSSTHTNNSTAAPLALAACGQSTATSWRTSPKIRPRFLPVPPLPPHRPLSMPMAAAAANARWSAAAASAHDRHWRSSVCRLTRPEALSQVKSLATAKCQTQ